jgi:hypothetical protein
MHSYSGYGLDIQSTQALSYLSGKLVNAKNHANQKITVDLSNQLPEALKESDCWPRLYPPNVEIESSGAEVWQQNGWLKVRYYKARSLALDFYISPKERQVFSHKPPEIPLGDVESFLIGPVLGCLQQLLGNTCLHASVLSYNGHAFALVGAKGAGKSTTSAALLEAGAKLVSDDIAVLKFDSESITVESGYPAIRLLPSSLEPYSGDMDGWNNVLSVGDKKIVPLPNKQLKWQFDPNKYALSAIYILQPRANIAEHILISRLAPSRSVVELAPHRYANLVIADKEKPTEFARLSKLARAVPVKTLVCNNDLQSLPSIATDILIDFTNEF